MDHSQHSIHDHGHHITPDNNVHNQHMGHMTTTVSPLLSSEDVHDQHMGSLHSTGDAGHSMSAAVDHMMSMAFHFGYNEVILFTPWKIDSISGLIGSMFVICLMATLYEGLKYYREYLFWKTYNLLEYRPVAIPKEAISTEENRTPTVQPSMFSWMHFYQTFLHIIQVTLSFLLMLIFMTYNVWLCLAVVFGAAIGYFLFCWKKSVIVDVTEHCH